MKVWAINKRKKAVRKVKIKIKSGFFLLLFEEMKVRMTVSIILDQERRNPGKTD